MYVCVCVYVYIYIYINKPPLGSWPFYTLTAHKPISFGWNFLGSSLHIQVFHPSRIRPWSWSQGTSIRTSNPGTFAYRDLKMPLNSSNIPGARSICPDRLVEKWPENSVELREFGEVRRIFARDDFFCRGLPDLAVRRPVMSSDSFHLIRCPKVGSGGVW